jgi:hypothetical protein
MSIVTIQELGKTSNGNPKAKVNGEWYFLSKEIGPLPPVNTKLEIREGSFTFPDGKPAKTIEAWRPASNGNGHVPQQNAPASSPPGYIEEASLRFISNVVGSAITAGAIKSPGQVLSWFQAAKSALLDKAAPAPFNDNLPADDRWGAPQ